MDYSIPDRFWHEPSHEPRLDGHGFLADPLAHAYANPHVTRIDINSLPACSVILGEPGIGKTHLVEQALHAAIASRGGDRVVHIELGTIGSEYAFDQAIFEDPRVAQWLNDDSTLELFLDGLDESLANLQTMAAHIRRALERLPVARLKLRLSCRATEWQRDLDQFLRKQWPDAAIREVAPLREADVALAATNVGVDAESFLTAVRPAGALAARPVTLAFFLNLAQQGQALPKTREELYRKGCLLLCGESNEGRQMRDQMPAFTEGQIYACAARIAAATVFGNRFEIVKSVTIPADSDTSVFWHQIAPATEDIDGEQFTVTVELVQATVSRALFRPNGLGRARWAHRTFAEFMAAEYLRTHSLRPEQKLDLVLTPNGHGVVPQLRETAAWLADVDKPLRRSLIQLDPVAVLRADVSTFSDDDRSALVDALFMRHAEEAFILRDLRADDLVKLRHPNLREQLAARLAEGDAPKRLVVEIASATGAEPFLDQMIDAVLDPASSFALRRAALDVIVGLPRTSTVGRLAVLLPDAIGTDYDCEIRGRLLDLLWPDFIDAKILFSCLSGEPPDENYYFGAFERFVREKLGGDFDADFAAAGLAWIPDRPHAREFDRHFENLVSRVLLFAYDHAGEEPFDTLLPAAIAAELRRLSTSVASLARRARTSPLADDVRKPLVAAIMTQLDRAHRHALPHFFVTEADMQWMLEQLQAADADRKHLWAQLMWAVWSRDDAAANDLLLRAAGEPAVADTFRGVLQPVNLGSPQAEKLKHEYALLHPAPAKPEPPPATDHWSRLAEALSSPKASWWAKAIYAAATDTGTYEGSIDAILATLRKRFETAGPEQLERAANEFVRHAPRVSVEDIGSRRPIPTLAFLAAIKYLGRERIDDEVLRGWLPALLIAPEHGGDPSEVAAIVAPLADPAYVSDFVLALFDLEEQQQTAEAFFLSLQVADRHWNDAIRAGLIDRLQRKLSPAVYGLVLELLLQKNVSDARSDAERRVTEATTAGQANDYAIEAAARLVEETGDAGWNVVWPFLQAFPDTDLRVLRRGLGPKNAYYIAPKLSPSHVRELARFLVDRHGVAPSMSERTPIQHVGLDLMSHLFHRGAVDEVRALREQYPELLGAESVTHAKNAFAEQQWHAPEPAAIFRMVTDARRRIVRDGAHLLEVITIALDEIQQSLRGDDPQVESLWNADRPKGENDIRNWILDRLKRKYEGLPSLFANKEVEVSAGYYTDIKVEARPQGQDVGRYPSLHATIEVKGCWHDDLKTAMTNQLLGLYLKDSESPHGIYLVLWFGSEGWSDADGRKAKCHQWTLDNARFFFDDQARKLSSGRTLIRAYVLDCSRPTKKTGADKPAKPRPRKTSSRKASAKRPAKRTARKPRS